MEAVLKQHPRAIGGRLLPKSWRTRTRLAGLVEAVSKRFWTQFKIPRIDFNAWSYSLCTACVACLALQKRAEYERKRAEEALQKAQAELAHVTRVTTLGELTTSIAHEIN